MVGIVVDGPEVGAGEDFFRAGIGFDGRPHLGHARTVHLHDSAILGNGTDRLSRKQRHGSQHHLDRAADSEGYGSVRDHGHRRCERGGGYA